MVEIGGNIALIALEVSLGVIVAMCEALGTIAHSVRLDIGLGNDV